MKRPLAVIGITMFFILLVYGTFTDTAFLLCLEIFSAAAFILSLLFKKTRQNMTLPTVFAVSVIACLLFLSFESTYYHTLSFSAADRQVEATVCEYPEFKKQYGRFYCVANIKTIDGKAAKGKIRLSFSETTDDIDVKLLSPGNKILFNGYVYKIGQNKTDIVQYFKSQGIYLGAYSIKNLQAKTPSLKPLRYYSGLLKRSIADKLTFDFDDDTAGILLSVLTGSKDYLKDSVYEKYQRSGVAHIMAVSGLHLSIAVLLLKALLERIRKIPKIVKTSLLLLLVLFIMTLADFSGSVKRAGIMMSLYLLSGFFSAKSDSLNNLGLAATAILLFNPYAVFDISFMLSFLCTLSIICIAVPVINLAESKWVLLKRPFPKTVLSSIIISLSVMVFTSPVTLLYFGSVSLISPVTNLLIVPAVPFIIAFAVVHLIFSSINLISAVSVPLCKIFAHYTLFIANVFSGMSFSCIVPQSREQRDFLMLIFALLSFIVFLTVKLLIKRRKKLSSRF